MVESFFPGVQAVCELAVVEAVDGCDPIAVAAGSGAVDEADAEIHEVHDAVSRFDDGVESLWERF